MRRVSAGLLVFSSFLALPELASPRAASYGQLQGTVRDIQGEVLPGAAVTLSGEAVMGERPVTTDLDGSYRFRALSPSRASRSSIAGASLRQARRERPRNNATPASSVSRLNGNVSTIRKTGVALPTRLAGASSRMPDVTCVIRSGQLVRRY